MRACACTHVKRTYSHEVLRSDLRRRNEWLSAMRVSLLSPLPHACLQTRTQIFAKQERARVRDPLSESAFARGEGGLGGMRGGRERHVYIHMHRSPFCAHSSLPFSTYAPARPPQLPVAFHSTLATSLCQNLLITRRRTQIIQTHIRHRSSYKLSRQKAPRAEGKLLQRRNRDRRPQRQGGGSHGGGGGRMRNFQCPEVLTRTLVLALQRWG